MPITTTSYNSDVLTNASIFSGFQLDDIKELAHANPNLRGYLQGYLAERVLREQILEIEGVQSVVKIPDASKEFGDFRVLYRDVNISVEAKSLATDSIRLDSIASSWSGMVRVKNVCKRSIHVPGLGVVSSSNLLKGNFDILAICCFAATGKWDFLFMRDEHLPERKGFPGLIKNSFRLNPVSTPHITSELKDLLDQSVILKTTLK